MAWIALGLEIAFLALAAGLRAWLQRRRTGTSGIVVSQPSVSRAERAAKALLGLTLIGLGASTLLAVSTWDVPATWAAPSSVRDVGAVLALTGIAGTLWAQVVMGADWRIGVDRQTDTRLVTSGPFRFARNPIYSAMVLFAAGIALLIPSAFSAGIVVLSIAGVELQVRRVEEPFLSQRHGQAFEGWARQIGRFAPRLGRIRG